MKLPVDEDREASGDNGEDKSRPDSEPTESEAPPVLVDEIVEPEGDDPKEPRSEAVKEPENARDAGPEQSSPPAPDEERSDRPGSDVESTSGVPAVLIVFLALGLLIAGLVVVGVYLMRSGEPELPLEQLDRDLVKRNQFLRDGWKGAATEQLRGFLGAKTVEDKAGYVVGGESRLPEMRAFYEAREIDDSDTPLAAFIHHDLELPDRTRGIFLMRYERPAQFNIREFFRPVAPLEVQYRVEDPGLLLSSFAMLDQFAMEPVRVMAFYKQVGDELRLDWDVYVQTKYRLLKEYSSFPRPGTSRIFRVIIQEDIPDYLFVDPKLVRYYRISEPSNAEDYVKVPVESSSQLGRALAELNWIGVQVDAVPTRTATVELEWTAGSDPKLRLKDLLCWEFLGLGGATASASPQGNSSMIRSGPPGSPAPEGDGRPANSSSP